MLSVEIVKLVEDFDGWKHDRDRLCPHEIGAKVSEIWEEYLCNGYAFDGDLSEHEVELLYEVLKENRNTGAFEVVRDFIVWFIRSFEWDTDCKETLMYIDAYDYFIKGEEIDPSHVAWKQWCESPKGMITFYADYYNRRYIDSMFPHYVDSLRTLIRS